VVVGDGVGVGELPVPGPVEVVYETGVYGVEQPSVQPEGSEKLYTSPLLTRLPLASVTWIW
jgi:hypothetical protein